MSVMISTVSIHIFMVFGIFLMVFGTVGNVTSIIVLSRKALSRLKIRSYLIALAVFDVLCLYLSLLPAVIVFSLGKDGKPRTALQCKLMIFSGFFAVDCSSWITVTITIERLLYVVRPFMIRHQKGTTIALSLVIGLIALINIPIALGWTAVDGKCDVAPVYYMVHFIITSYIPAIIMVVSNIIIAYTLCRRPKLGSSSASKHNGSIRIALAVNLIFLCTTFPVTIVWAVLGKLYLQLYVMFYANYAVNFISYIIAGQVFREELKAMLCAKSVCCREAGAYSPSSAKTTETAPATDTTV